MPSKYPFELQVFDLSSTSVEAAVKSVYAKLEELHRQGYSQAQYLASKVSFVLVADHQRVYKTLQVIQLLLCVLSSLLGCLPP